MAAVAALYPQFTNLGIEILAISTDSVHTHKAFKESSPALRNTPFPLLSDRNLEISKAYRVLDTHAGASYRATLFIDPDGVITSKLIYPKEVGRNTYEMLRLMQGILHGKATGSGVPANWVPDQASNTSQKR